MNVTLTGASGRLGSETCRLLVEQGHSVRAVDRQERADLPVRVEPADLLERDRCYQVLAGAEAVVHLANHPRYWPGADAQRVFNENVAMNMNVFEAAHDLGVKKIVFASSVQVITGHYTGPTSAAPPPACLPLDGNAPADPGNPYALSKYVGEQMLAYFARLGTPSAVAIRFPALIRPEDVPEIRRRVCRFDPRDGFAWLFFSDAARLLSAVLQSSLPGFRVYLPAARTNGSGKPAADAVRTFYRGVPLRCPLEQMDCLVDISAITRETGWTPQLNEL